MLEIEQQYAKHCDWIKIGKNVKMGMTVNIGDDGFGFEMQDGKYKIPLTRRSHTYGVVISDNVEIGANSVIHRGRWRDTVIGAGTKIDSLVHVAHNVDIGRNCLIVAGTVLGGSCTIGDSSFIGENVSIKQGVKIANNVTIGMGSVVRHHITQPNSTWAMKADPKGNLIMVKIADVQKF